MSKKSVYYHANYLSSTLDNKSPLRVGVFELGKLYTLKGQYIDISFVETPGLYYEKVNSRLLEILYVR